jgi:trehalose-phosphatase
MSELTDAFSQLEEWRARRAAAGTMLIALDFDGTISPIVADPADAQMLPAARAAIASLLQRHDTTVAFISGRSIDDLSGRCGCPGAYYAGNHGLQIRGANMDFVHPAAQALVPMIQDFSRAIQAAFSNESLVLVENKQLSLSIHYRKIDDPTHQQRIVDVVTSQFAAFNKPSMRMTYGKRVVEIRPNVSWNKGDALLFLQKQLSPRPDTLVPVIFAGDDTTDEDGFRVMSGEATVLVAEHHRETAATSIVKTPDDVARLLGALNEERR